MSNNQEQQLATEIFSLANDPLGFVLFAFPWGRKNTPLEKFPEGPDIWTIELFLDIHDHILRNDQMIAAGEEPEAFQSAIASGHGIGKSACVAWLIIYFMSTRRYCRGTVTANTGSQLETKTWPELLKWHNLAINKHWFNWTATQYTCVLEKNSEKNWKFDAVTWSEERTEAFAGSHNASSAIITIYDEASAIPDVIWEVSEGAMTDGEAYWFAFGNPTRNTGRFRQCFGKLKHRWRRRNIDSRNVRITKKKKLNQIIEDYGEDSDVARVRVKGQFPSQGDKQFIPIKLVDDAQNRPDQDFDPGAPLIMGVDVARHGGDQCVIRFRQGMDARSIPPLKYRGIDADDYADRIAEAMDKYNPDKVFIDSGGGGAQIHDFLMSSGYRTTIVNFGGGTTPESPGANKRAQMYWDCRDWLKHGTIDKDQELYDDLIGPEYRTHRTNQKTVLESKEEMKARGLSSPDDGDALVLTFAGPVARKDRRHSRNSNSRPKIADGAEEMFG